MVIAYINKLYSKIIDKITGAKDKNRIGIFGEVLAKFVKVES